MKTHHFRISFHFQTTFQFFLIYNIEYVKLFKWSCRSSTFLKEINLNVKVSCYSSVFLYLDFQLYNTMGTSYPTEDGSLRVFDGPGVAGAVLQTALSLIKQACCAGCRFRPFPMKLHQKAKSTHSAKLPQLLNH